MKVTSVTFVQADTLPRRIVNTETQANVRVILDNLAKAKAGQALIIAGDDIKKFERYALQKKLQKAGAHVTVGNVEHPTTGKPALSIRIMSDVEWREYLGTPKPSGRPASKK